MAANIIPRLKSYNEYEASLRLFLYTSAWTIIIRYSPGLHISAGK